MWSLATPLALMVLPLPFLARLLLPRAEVAAHALHVPPTVAALLGGGAPARMSGAARRVLPVVLWVSLVLALAGPQRLASTAALPASGRDIVLVLDLSGSMEIEDFELDGAVVQRLTAVKKVAADFARARSGDRLGLVIFGADPYFAAPMTYDVEAVARAVEEATIGISGRSTALSDGLGLALKRLADSPSQSRVVILLSDGIDTSGTVAPVGAAKLAEQMGVKLHTIAMGVKAVGEEGATRDAVDAETLKTMAEATGGTAFRVRATADLEAVGAEIDRMEGDLHETAAVVIHRSYWVWPGALAALAVFAMLLDRGRAGK